MLCSGASYNPDIRTTVEETAYIASLFNLPVCVPGCKLDLNSKFTAISGDEAFSSESVSGLQQYIKANGADVLFVNGALTDKIASEINASAKLLAETYIAAVDASRLLLCKAAYDKLKRLSAGLLVLKATKLLAVTVNPFSAYGNHYDKELFIGMTAEAVNRAELNVPVIDVTDIKNA